MHKKLNNAKKEEIKKINFNEVNSIVNINEHFKIIKEFYSSKNKSIIFDFFYGYFANEIKCSSCNHTKRNIQLFTFLDLPIITKYNKNLESLEDCIENYLSLNNEEGNKNYTCSNCNKSCLTLQNIILELPPILMINLKRIGENETYLNDIKIPFELEVNKIKNANINSIYELVGFIRHLGNEKGGHNYTVCKNMFDDQWYSYDDTIITELEKNPSTKDSFFYCYIKKGDDIQNIKYLRGIPNS